MIKERIDFKFFVKIYILYSSFTLLLLDFGPINYDLTNSFKLHVFIYIYILSFCLGFLFFKNRILKDENIGIEKINNIKKKNDLTINKLLNYGIFLNLFLFLFLAMNSTNSTSISILFSKIVNGITNPATSYYDKVLYGRTLNTYITIAFLFIYPFMLLILTLSVYNFKKISILKKIIVVITSILELSRWIAMGTNKGVFDFLILLISYFIIIKITNKYDSNQNKIKKNKLSVKSKVLLVVIGLSVFFMFNYFISNRRYSTSNNLSDSVISGYKYLSNYICNGYKGMDYTLSLDWEPTYGIGHSMFLVSQFDSFFDKNINDLTYQKRAEIFGWSSTVNWHTAYTWFANDLSFYGVMLLMFFLGFLCADLITSIIIYHDYYSMVLFYLMMMFIFYASANNQVLSFSNTMISVWIFLPLKLLKRGKVHE